MSRPPLVERDEICRVGALLIASGRRVTGYALRHEIGHGRPDYLIRVWGENAPRVGVPENDAPAIALPASLKELSDRTADTLNKSLAHTVADAWKQAITAADYRVAQEHADAVAATRRAAEEIVEASDALEAADARADALESANEKLRNELDEAHKRNAVLEERCTVALHDVAAGEEKIVALTTELQEARAAAAKASGRADILEAQLARWHANMVVATDDVGEPATATESRAHQSVLLMATRSKPVGK